MDRKHIVSIAVGLLMTGWAGLAYAQDAQQDQGVQPAPGSAPTVIRPGGTTAGDDSQPDSTEPSDEAPAEADADATGDDTPETPAVFDSTQGALIRPDRSPVNPNEFGKIRPQQSPVNPNEFDKIRPDGTGLAGDIRVMRVDELRVNPDDFDRIRPDATGFEERIRVISLDEARINPNTFRAIDPDDGIVIRPGEFERIGRPSTLGELASLRQLAAADRARRFRDAFSQVQRQAEELEPGSEALPLRRDVEELARGAEELRVRFTQLRGEFDQLERGADAQRARQVAQLFAELQASLALVGLELERRGDADFPNDLDINLELLEAALIALEEGSFE